MKINYNKIIIYSILFIIVISIILYFRNSIRYYMNKLTNIGNDAQITIQKLNKFFTKIDHLLKYSEEDIVNFETKVSRIINRVDNMTAFLETSINTLSLNDITYFKDKLNNIFNIVNELMKNVGSILSQVDINKLQSMATLSLDNANNLIQNVNSKLSQVDIDKLQVLISSVLSKSENLLNYMMNVINKVNAEDIVLLKEYINSSISQLNTAVNYVKDKFKDVTDEDVVKLQTNLKSMYNRGDKILNFLDDKVNLYNKYNINGELDKKIESIFNSFRNIIVEIDDTINKYTNNLLDNDTLTMILKSLFKNLDIIFVNYADLLKKDPTIFLRMTQNIDNLTDVLKKVGIEIDLYQRYGLLPYLNLDFSKINLNPLSKLYNTNPVIESGVTTDRSSKLREYDIEKKIQDEKNRLASMSIAMSWGIDPKHIDEYNKMIENRVRNQYQMSSIQPSIPVQTIIAQQPAMPSQLVNVSETPTLTSADIELYEYFTL